VVGRNGRGRSHKDGCLSLGEKDGEEHALHGMMGIVLTPTVATTMFAQSAMVTTGGLPAGVTGRREVPVETC